MSGLSGLSGLSLLSPLRRLTSFASGGAASSKSDPAKPPAVKSTLERIRAERSRAAAAHHRSDCESSQSEKTSEEATEEANEEATEEVTEETTEQANEETTEQSTLHRSSPLSEERSPAGVPTGSGAIGASIGEARARYEHFLQLGTLQLIERNHSAAAISGHAAMSQVFHVHPLISLPLRIPLTPRNAPRRIRCSVLSTSRPSTHLSRHSTLCVQRSFGTL